MQNPQIVQNGWGKLLEKSGRQTRTGSRSAPPMGEEEGWAVKWLKGSLGQLHAAQESPYWVEPREENSRAALLGVEFFNPEN